MDSGAVYNRFFCSHFCPRTGELSASYNFKRSDTNSKTKIKNRYKFNLKKKEIHKALYCYGLKGLKLGMCLRISNIFKHRKPHNNQNQRNNQEHSAIIPSSLRMTPLGCDYWSQGNYSKHKVVCAQSRQGSRISSACFNSKILDQLMTQTGSLSECHLYLYLNGSGAQTPPLQNSWLHKWVFL